MLSILKEIILTNIVQNAEHEFDYIPDDEYYDLGDFETDNLGVYDLDFCDRIFEQWKDDCDYGSDYYYSTSINQDDHWRDVLFIKNITSKYAPDYYWHSDYWRIPMTKEISDEIEKIKAKFDQFII
jgi:hypothetical protein